MNDNTPLPGNDLGLPNAKTLAGLAGDARGLAARMNSAAHMLDLAALTTRHFHETPDPLSLSDESDLAAEGLIALYDELLHIAIQTAEYMDEWHEKLNELSVAGMAAKQKLEGTA
jgi:hypothetical protein